VSQSREATALSSRDTATGPALSRRALLASAAASATLVPWRQALAQPARSGADRALVTITLDLEMSRHYPTWDDTHWDYEKGNLDAATKRYAVEAADRVRKRGGRIHFFVVGRVLEQENVEWLRKLHEDGHPLGNHTYDHVNVKATEPRQIQFRFERAPWLIEGKAPAEVIAENIRLTTRAMKTRLGVEPAGFRTPGGFTNGLADRPDVQQMLLEQGFRWVSSRYPAHPLGDMGKGPTPEVIEAIVQAQTRAQPFEYPSGLVEVPMSPVSDVSALRAGRWSLEHFLEAIRAGVGWAIEHRAVFDFLAHPSCLVVTDPQFRAIDLICDLVARAGPRATLADLDTIALRGKDRKVD
jgi:peptidoglycan/xylan/chitin deacetylase (PgdA/CDA1 family)